jgi:hypothetical protein
VNNVSSFGCLILVFVAALVAYLGAKGFKMAEDEKERIRKEKLEELRREQERLRRERELSERMAKRNMSVEGYRVVSPVLPHDGVKTGRVQSSRTNPASKPRAATSLGHSNYNSRYNTSPDGGFIANPVSLYQYDTPSYSADYPSSRDDSPSYDSGGSDDSSGSSSDW